MKIRRGRALLCCLGVSGCMLAEPQVERVPETRMDLSVDTTPRRPQAMRPLGNPAVPVDPKDGATGRHVDFGPESRLVLPSHRDLSAAFGSLPPRDSLYVALDTTDETRLAPPAASGAEAGYRLNFEDADVRDVLQAVLGNVLKLNYTLAPNATGRITISSANPQNKAELLSTLETALATQGLSMVRIGSTYNITATAIGGGTVEDDVATLGYGISVVPLHFTSTAAMSKLLAGLVTDTDSLKVNAALNAMVVRGPAPRRAEIVLAIKSFDVDVMRDQSISVFELKRAKPDEIVAELNHIFNSETSEATNGLVTFKPVARLRSVMVISRTPSLIRRAGIWIRRLDSVDQKTSTNVYVYRPKFRDARELVKLVNGLFSAQGGMQGEESNQGTSADGFQQAGAGNGQSQQGSSVSAPGLLGQNPGQQGGGQAAVGTSPTTFGALTGGAGQAQNGSSGTVADPIETGQPGQSNTRKLSLAADASNNSIVAYTDGATYAKILSVMRQLDVAPLQVAVNVIIAEVQLNDELKYGVQFYLKHHDSGSIGLSDAASTALSSALPGFNFLLGKASSPDVVLSALDSVSHVEILSSPSIVVMENKPATLQVGDQVPVTTRTAQSNLTADAPTVNSVDYKDTGIILKILPRVGQDGSVAMEIDQEISSVSNNTSTLTPTISKRRIASDISVLSGQTVLLAGLISDRYQKSKGSIPFLSDTPGIGKFFDNKDDSAARTELVVFIRPVVVRDSNGAEVVADEFKSHLRAIRAHQPAYDKP